MEQSLNLTTVEVEAKNVTLPSCFYNPILQVKILFDRRLLLASFCY